MFLCKACFRAYHQNTRTLSIVLCKSTKKIIYREAVFLCNTSGQAVYINLVVLQK